MRLSLFSIKGRPAFASALLALVIVMPALAQAPADSRPVGMMSKRFSARIRLIPDIGHVPQFEAPEILHAKLVAFLKRN